MMEMKVESGRKRKKQETKIEGEMSEMIVMKTKKMNQNDK